MQLSDRYTFDFEIQTMVTMFMNALRDIIIKRFNESKEAQDRIKVRFVYAPKQRVLHDLLDKDQNLILPVVACYITNLSRDLNRVFNKITGTYNPVVGGGSVTNEKSPLPIDLGLSVSILTRYQEDMDQILSHIIPYINPYFIVSWRTPGRPDHEIRSSVFWDGNAQITYPYDIAATSVARVAADLTFTFKGWLFQAVPTEQVGVIHNIHSYYNNNIYTKIPNEFLLESKSAELSGIQDYLAITGVPPQPRTIEPYTMKANTSQAFFVYGEGFSQITNVYLSGAPIETVSTLQNPFSGSSELSGSYLPFYGYKLDNNSWRYNKDNFLTFVAPSSIDTEGRMDLIVEGPAGYGTLISSVKQNTFNPFNETLVEYNNYVPYQVPYLSGIAVS